jgi:hypothetical protein
MTLAGVLSALGLGAARAARALVARLPAGPLAVAAVDEEVVRALEKAGHRAIAADRPPSGERADAALALGLPEGDEALLVLERLLRATRPGGSVLIGRTAPRAESRARIAGLMLRAGLVAPRQDVDDGNVVTTGEVPRVAP